MSEWLRKHAVLIGVIVGIAGVIIAFLAFFMDQIPVYYEDNDMDGYGNSDKSIRSIWQPNGYVKKSGDCYDQNDKAKPGIVSFYAHHRGDDSFDYDCNGKAEREYTQGGSCSNGTANVGWNDNIPRCGKKGNWLVDCDRRVSGLRIRTVRETEASVLSHK